MIKKEDLKGRNLKFFNFNGVKTIYHEGIAFDCLPEWDCIECCKTPADLNEEEYKTLLEIGYSDFAYEIAHGIFKLKKKNNACIFLENGKCKIHEYKPASCRAQPFVPVYFDFHSIELVVLIEPQAYDWCYGLQEGEMDEELLKDISKACKKLSFDRVKFYENFKESHESFLIAALSIPEKVGLIAGSPMKNLCFCCGFPLKTTAAYDIYSIKRDYVEYENALICEKCREKLKDKLNEENIIVLRDSLFANPKLINYFKI
mgnify:CR=1 FL=1